MSDDISVRSDATGRIITARDALWLKCLLEMLPGPQLAELVRRVEADKDRLVLPGIRRDLRLIALPGRIGLKQGGSS